MSATQDLNVVGLEPWLPWPLKGWGWWSQPVRAERLAVLRIAMAACLVIDLLTTYRAHLLDYFGTGDLGGSRMFAYYGEAPALNWSLLRGIDEPWLLTGAFWVWVAATVMLLAGCWTRMAAILTWVLSMSFANANPNIDNAGDTIRGITLFYLMLCPCGAAWSVDRFFQGRREATTAPAYVWPWALRLLFIQLILIYFMNGLYKVTGANWIRGDSLYYILCDLTLTRVSIAQIPIPFVVTQVFTWLVLAWELSFPALVLFRWTRMPALLIGFAFHVGIFAIMELGGFAPYVLCLYLPVLPWDRWLEGVAAPRAANASPWVSAVSSSQVSRPSSTPLSPRVQGERGRFLV